jgi:hypothetical protein
MRFVGDIALDAEVRALASGAITEGAPVIVNTDGTVGVCVDAITGGFGTAVEFESGDTRSGSDSIKGTFDSNSNKVVIGYKDLGNSSYGTAVVATIDPSDNSVSFGTPVVFESAETEYIDLAFDSNVNKVVIAYSDLGDSYAGKAIIGTVSSTAISFGSAVTFKTRTGSDGVLNNTLVFDSNANKTAVFYVDFADSQKLFCRVISISGTTPSYGTEVEVAQSQYGASSGISGVFDSNSNKVVIFYIDYGDSNKGKARVGTISGTNISFGTAAVFRSGAYSFSGASAFDSTNNKTVNIYRDNDNSQYGTAVVGTVSGTDITFGTPVVYTSHAVNFQGCVYDSSVNRIIVLYRNSSVGDTGNYNVAKVSGTTLNFGTAAIYLNFATGDTPYGTYDSNAERILLPYRDTQDSNKGKAVVMKTPVAGNLTSENFIGFADAVYADGQKATVKTTGSIARNNIQGASTSSTLGTKVVISSSYDDAGTLGKNGVAFDSTSNRIVIHYRDQTSGNSHSGLTRSLNYVAVGTVSNNSISFGTSVSVRTNPDDNTDSCAITFDSNSNRIVVAYGAASRGYAKVGTVDSSDNSISFGSETEFRDDTVGMTNLCFDSSNNKVVIAYRDNGNSLYGTVRVGTVDPSDNSITFGTAVVFESATIFDPRIDFDSSNNKVVIAYEDVGNSNYGTAIVGTVSGTGISFGSPVVFESATLGRGIGNTFDSTNNKMVITYVDNGNSEYGTAIVGTVSGTGISFGTPAVFNSGATEMPNALFSSVGGTVIISYRDEASGSASGKGPGTFLEGTVSGTGISFGSSTVYDSGNGDAEAALGYDSQNNRVVIAYADESAQNAGTGLGDAATARVIAPTGVLGDLTIGQQYFVQTDGKLSTSADSPSVIAGTAIGTSDIIVKG